MSIIKYYGTFRIPCICHHQRMSFQTTAYLQNSCERERQVILMASAMAFPPTVCAQWPVGNTPRLTYSHSSGYLHIFAQTTLHRSVTRKEKKTGFYSCSLIQGHRLKRFSIYLQCPAGTRTRPATWYFFRYPTQPDSVLEIIG